MRTISADTKIATVIGLLNTGYVGEQQRAECVALLMEARAEITRQLPKILSREVRTALIGYV